LRVAGAGAALIAGILFGLSNGFVPNAGGRLFGELHRTLFWGIWLLVPLLTADCLSRERREGTLGLLFLTRLRAGDIVIAKGFVHGLRALALLLAVAPVLSVAFVMGGVSWNQVVLSFLLNLSVICWALAAGLLASASSKHWAQAVIRTALLAVCFILVLATAVGWALLPPTRPGIGIGMTVVRWQASGDYMLLSGMRFLSNPASGVALFPPVYSGPLSSWSGPIQVSPATGIRVWRAGGGPPLLSPRSAPLLWSAAEVALASLLVLAGAIWLAGLWTRRVWQEEPPSARVLWWRRTFFTPVLWLSFFRRWMRRKLERNPIGWLEQRTWSGRLVTWAWFSIIVCIYSSILGHPNLFRSPEGLGEILAWLLAGSMALSSAASFRRERESGVLELLLVSPLGERQIVFGRLAGLWSQFLPAFGLLLTLWCYIASFSPFPRADADSSGALVFFLTTFFSVPVVGLYFSLCYRNFFSAFLATLAVGLLLPVWSWDLLGLAWWFVNTADLQRSSWGDAVITQIIIATICWVSLNARLKRRAFPLERIQA